jgi:transcriptional regulator with XRE-family HTH domain
MTARAAGVEFGQRLRAVRAEHGVPQDNLARRVGVHATAIGRFERAAREPQLGTILRLAKGLGVKPGELVDGLAGEEAR